ncbi:hypothetical protein EKO27_g11642 [Xylaria grammica]|uniref:Uncharacterized protein n=1 Tax=Xylaria grammica TaxID=363999 RepID=A0A439CMS5_9PEZI|nr:hypothetical protein EKO27_g11642 [Xylaria grammica]
MRDRRAQEERERQRRADTIRGYVAQHALDAQSRLDTAWFHLACTQAKVHDNVLRIAGLERQVRELCESGGVRDPEHAYAVLMGADSSGSADVNVNGFGGGYGEGEGDGGLVGPWSASSLARAEDEFDRFVADMQMGGGSQGTARSERWQGRCDDDVSGDSGVAGVGSRDRSRFPRQGPNGREYHG